MVHWHKIILRRMSKKPRAACPWAVSFTWNLPQEMFEFLKVCLLCEEKGGITVKNTRCVVEIHVTQQDKLQHLFTSLANKYKQSLSLADTFFKKEDGSYSTIILETHHAAHFHYSKTLEKMTFKAKYGHFNRNGIPQHTLV